MPFQVEFTNEADGIVERIYDYIAERSPDGAQRWKSALCKAVGRLEESADTFAAAAESDLFPEMIREVYFKTRRGRCYRMLFVVGDIVATVVSVRGPGQDFVTLDDIRLPE